MKKTIILSALALLSMFVVAQQQQASYLAYIAQYKEIALRQQAEHKIPACISMAQGLLESSAGQSVLAREANNHFGIKCTSDWKGESFLKDDDQKNDCFRKYNNAEESWNDHSVFLERSRYASLFALDINDYKGWAKGLKACGYATDSKYPEKLIQLIETYQLDQLGNATATQETETTPVSQKIETTPKTEQATLQEQPAKASKTTKSKKTVQKKATVKKEENAETAEEEGEVLTLKDAAKMEDVNLYHSHKSGWQNGTRYVIVQEGESFASLAYFLNIREKTLRKINDASDGREVSAGDRIYIYPKHNRASMKHHFYYVKTGDSAWSISQKFGMKMKSLYNLNGIKEGIPLVTKQKLVLR